MKEASGEFSMTLVVIIGAIAVIAILNGLKPFLGNWIKSQWDGISINNTTIKPSTTQKNIS